VRNEALEVSVGEMKLLEKLLEIIEERRKRR